MTDAEHGPPVFDEQAALAELERLREQIVQLRSKRVAADEEFAPRRRYGSAPLIVKRQPATRNLVTVGALLLLAAGGVVTSTLRKNSHEAAAPQPIVAAQPAASDTDTSPAATPSITPSPYESQITTIRPVWVRVVADGERVVERELPAQARIPFRATRSVVIRARDAGALRLSIGGRDQGPLGADGVVVTQTFSVPQNATR